MQLPFFYVVPICIHYLKRLIKTSYAQKSIKTKVTLVTRTLAPRRLKTLRLRIRPTFAPPSPQSRNQIAWATCGRTKCDKRTTNLRMRPLIALWSPFDRHLFAPRWRTKNATIFLFAIQVPGQPFYEWNLKLIHLRHAFGFFCSFFVRIKSAMATEWRIKYEQFSISS